MPVKVGKYEIHGRAWTRQYGCGLFRTRPISDRNVAIKLVHSEALNNEKTGDRFKRLFFNEAHAASVLNHPNILRVYDANIEGEYYYLVMDYIPEAKTLAGVIVRVTLYCRSGMLLMLSTIARRHWTMPIGRALFTAILNPTTSCKPVPEISRLRISVWP